MENAWIVSLSDEPLTESELLKFCEYSSIRLAKQPEERPYEQSDEGLPADREGVFMSAEFMDRMLLTPEHYDFACDQFSENKIQEYHNGPLTIPFKNRLKEVKKKGGHTWDELAKIFDVYSWRNLSNIVNYRKNARTEKVEKILEGIIDLEKQVGGGE
jgi:hypothetical protein